ncbi:MAG: polyprenyl diphosphate synthase [Deltaproteobacteria bacterium]|nr:polyprenyl diphosphate synthase [Deltaproteobacteria bacterium]
MTTIPQHVAIIMDGNGRWAKAHGLARPFGHKKGVEAAEEIINAALDFKIPYLTLFAFSDENWSRPLEEIKTVMLLLRQYLKTKKKKMIENGIRFQTIGDLSKLSAEVQQTIAETKEATRDGKTLTLILALSYGARNEIVRACNRVLQNGWPREKPLTEEDFKKYLDTKDFPDPDLLIRTSGEHRISNYLLWQVAYAEFYFTKKFWPDFTPADLREALEEYANRERRFGKTSDQL